MYGRVGRTFIAIIINRTLLYQKPNEYIEYAPFATQFLTPAIYDDAVNGNNNNDHILKDII